MNMYETVCCKLLPRHLNDVPAYPYREGDAGTRARLGQRLLQLQGFSFAVIFHPKMLVFSSASAGCN